MRSAILCRYGEIFLKSGNRRRFEDLAGTSRALSDLPGVGIDTPHGRIVAHADAGVVDEACARLERVFGLVSLSWRRASPRHRRYRQRRRGRGAPALGRRAGPPRSRSRAGARTSGSRCGRRRSRASSARASWRATGLAVDVHPRR